MKLWLIKWRDDLDEAKDPWDFPYDCLHGALVRAETEEAARKVLSESRFCGEEKRKEPRAWLSSEFSACIEIASEGETEIILKDFMEG